MKRFLNATKRMRKIEWNGKRKGKKIVQIFWKAGTDQIPTEFSQGKKKSTISRNWDTKLIHIMRKNWETGIADEKLHSVYLETLQWNRWSNQVTQFIQKCCTTKHKGIFEDEKDWMKSQTKGKEKKKFGFLKGRNWPNSYRIYPWEERHYMTLLRSKTYLFYEEKTEKLKLQKKNYTLCI